MNTYIPYTYILKFKLTGQLYYGASYAVSKYRLANPTKLWVSYFTSSKIVKDLIAKHGADSFEYQVRRTFKTPEEALLWEQRFLTRVKAASSPLWLNRSNGGRKFVPGHSAETRAKMSASAKRRGNPPLSEETKKKIGAANKGKIRPAVSDITKERQSLAAKARVRKPLTQETKDKIAASLLGRKRSEEDRKKMVEGHAKRKLSSLK